jgi:3-hydroxyisobutyrate dehydrogenase
MTEVTQVAPKIGFVGLGDMGGPMALNLAKAGVDLTVFDLRSEAVERLRLAGAKAAGSVGEVAADVDVLSTCVLYDHQVREIFLGSEGILANAKEGLVALIHSTILPDTVAEISRQAKDRGIAILDAPVSGSSIASRAGTLTVMVGGDAEALVAAGPLLSIVGENIIHVGSPGMGQVAKLANNIMSLGNQTVAMEAVRFAEAFGLDRRMLFDVVKVSTGASWAATNYEHFDRFGTEHTLAGTPELSHRLGLDLRYAVSLAQDRSTYLPVVSLCSQVMPGMFDDRWDRIAAERQETSLPDESAGNR